MYTYTYMYKPSAPTMFALVRVVYVRHTVVAAAKRQAPKVLCAHTAWWRLQQQHCRPAPRLSCCCSSTMSNAAAHSSHLQRAATQWPDSIPAAAVAASHAPAVQRWSATKLASTIDAYTAAVSCALQEAHEPHSAATDNAAASRLERATCLVQEFLSACAAAGHTPHSAAGVQGAAEGMLHSIVASCKEFVEGGYQGAAVTATRLLLDCCVLPEYGNAKGPVHQALTQVVAASARAGNTAAEVGAAATVAVPRVDLHEPLYTALLNAWAAAAGLGDRSALGAAKSLWLAAEDYCCDSDAWHIRGVREAMLRVCAQSCAAASDGEQGRATAMHLMRAWHEEADEADANTIWPSPVACSHALQTLAYARGDGVFEDACWLLHKYVELRLRDGGSGVLQQALHVCSQHQHLDFFRENLFHLLAARSDSIQDDARLSLRAAFGGTVTDEMMQCVEDGSVMHDEAGRRATLKSMAAKASATVAATADTAPRLLAAAETNGAPPATLSTLRDLLATLDGALTTRDCNALVDSVCWAINDGQSGREQTVLWLDAVRQLFDAMAAVGGAVGVDQHSLSAVLQCYAAAARHGVATAAADATTLLLDGSVTPTEVSYNCLLNVLAATAASGASTCAAARQLAASGERVLKEMLAHAKALGGGGPCAPSVATYTPLLSMYGIVERTCGVGSGGADACLRLLRSMPAEGSGVQPNAIAYGAAIDAFAHAASHGHPRALGVAVKLLREAARVGGDAAPTVVMYGAVMKACARAARADHSRAAATATATALGLLREMQVAGGDLAPNAQIYSTAIDALSAAGTAKALKQAVELLRQAQAGGGEAARSAVVSNTVLKVCASAARARVPGAVATAEQLVARMQQQQQQQQYAGDGADGVARPDAHTYATLMNVYANAAASGDFGVWRLAVELLRASAEEGGAVAPDVVSYATTIKACTAGVQAGQSEALEASVALLHEMQAAGGALAPTVWIYNAVITAHANAAARGVAANQAWRRARALLRQAKEAGGPATPDLVTYHSAMKACANALRHGEPRALMGALHLLGELRVKREEGDSSLSPTRLSYSIAIDACANAAATGVEDAFHLALQLLHEAAGVGGDVAPNTVMYTAVLKACAGAARHQVPQAASMAMKLLDEMSKSHAAGNKDVVPNSRTYTAVLRACTAQGSERALRDGKAVVRRLVADRACPTDRSCIHAILELYKKSTKGYRGLARDHLPTLLSRCAARNDEHLRALLTQYLGLKTAQRLLSH